MSKKKRPDREWEAIARQYVSGDFQFVGDSALPRVVCGGKRFTNIYGGNLSGYHKPPQVGVK